MRRTRAGWAEIPEPCPAGHVGEHGRPDVMPGWGACPTCGRMGRQWTCRRDGCGQVVHDPDCCGPSYRRPAG